MPFDPIPLPAVERLTVPAESLQWLDIVVCSHEKIQTVTPRSDGYVDVTVDTHESTMHVPAGELFEVDRMFPS